MLLIALRAPILQEKCTLKFASKSEIAGQHKITSGEVKKNVKEKDLRRSRVFWDDRRIERKRLGGFQGKEGNFRKEEGVEIIKYSKDSNLRKYKEFEI